MATIKRYRQAPVVLIDEVRTRDDSNKQAVKLSAYYRCNPNMDLTVLIPKGLTKPQIVERLGRISIVQEYKMEARV